MPASHGARTTGAALVVLCVCAPLVAAAGPITLTAADGTGLRLVSVRANAVVEGPLAFTELHLNFENPLRREIEGRFQIDLPEGASISRFAMRLPTGWQEAEMVERDAARDVYESYLRRRIDPALLERSAGSSFAARVYPIPARGRKELRIAYSQELPSAVSPLRLPLRGLPRMDLLSIRALRRAGAGYVEEHQRRWSYLPDRDHEIAPAAGIDGLWHGRLAVARVRPSLPEQLEPLGGLLVLVDSSASVGAELPHLARRLAALLAALEARHGGQTPLRIAAFDQEVVSVFTGRLSQLQPGDIDRLGARRALGASDLSRALTWAAEQSGYDRLLIVSDGLATAGQTTEVELRRVLGRLRPLCRRLDVLLTAGTRDERMLAHLARGVLERDGVLLEASAPAALLARRLSLQVQREVRVKVPGALWVWPEVLDGIQPGDERLVYLELPAGASRAPRTIVLEVGGPLRVRLHPTTRPLLERQWVRARIVWLEAGRRTLKGSEPELSYLSGPLRDQLAELLDTHRRQQIAELSVRHRVPSDETSFLILETEQDYLDHGISRHALHGILTVGPAGVRLVQRDRLFVRDGGSTTSPDLGPPRPPRPRIRSGSPGPSEAAPIRRTRAPMILVASVSVRGSLDKEIIRRVVRHHIRQVRHCYERELPTNRQLRGRVTVELVLDAGSGVVQAARVRDTTLHNAAVERCVLESARGWLFPAARPSDGEIIINYPFVFRPDGSSWEPSAPPSVSVAPSSRSMDRRRAHVQREPRRPEPPPPPPPPPPLFGRMRELHRLFARGARAEALALARRWQANEPASVLALLGLGEALQASGELVEASRAYGSIIDLYPARPELRRLAGARLEALGSRGLPLAVDTYAAALRQRSDHPTGHRLLAYALLRAGQPARAFRTIDVALTRGFDRWRFPLHEAVLRDDLGIIAAAWLRRAPEQRRAVTSRLVKHGAELSTTPSVRFVLSWESDASDLDLELSGARVAARRYANITGGYGPECVVVEGAGPRAGGGYRLEVTAVSLGPAGFAMGKVQAVAHDGRGRVSIADRPFVLMNERAVVDLGRWHN